MKIKKIVGLFLLINALNVFGDNIEHFKMVDNLYKEKNFSQALVESEKYLKMYPQSKHYNSMMDKIGKIYFLNKNYTKSIEVFKKLYSSQKRKLERDETIYYIARSYALLGEKEKYKFYLNNISSRKIYEKAEYQIAVDLLSGDYNKEAIGLFKKIIERKDSSYDNALLNIGIAYYNLKEYESSFKVLEEFTRKNPKGNTTIIKYLKGSSLYKTERIDEAISYFNQIVSLGLEGRYNKKAILTLIEIYANRKDEEKVNYYLEKIKGTKEYDTAMIMMGDLYVTKEKYDTALSIYNKSSNLEEPKLVFGEAYSLYKLGNYEKALQKFESLKNTDYYNQSVYHIFAIKYKLKRYKEIIANREIIKKIVVTQTDTDNIIRIIANSAYRLGDYKLAKDYYGRLFAISTNIDNLFRVILLDSQILDMADLENRFRQYKKLFPNDNKYKKDIYLYTGDAYFKSGNNEKAEEIYKQYLNGNFNLEVLSSLVSVLLEEKKYDEMEKYLNLVEEEDRYNYLRGISAIGLGKYEIANSYLEKAQNLTVDINLKNRISLNKIRNFFLWSKYDQAILVGETFLGKINSEKDREIYSEVLDKVGLSYFRLGNYNRAREYYTRITEIEGYEVYGKYQIADSYYNEKKYDTALEKYKNIFESYEETFYGEQAYYRYINILKQKNNSEEFEMRKNEFLQKYPESKLRGTLLNLSANYYSDNDDTEKAIETINKISNENSEDATLQENNNIRIVNLKLNNKDYKGIEDYIALISDENEKAYYYSRYYNVKKDVKAVAEYKKILNSEKYKSYAIKNLADYYYNTKKYKEAEKFYRDYLKDNSEEEYIVYRLAYISELSKNTKESLRLYKKVYDKYKGKYEVEALMRAADIYDGQEKNEQAKNLFFRLYKVKNNKKLHEYTLEKLIYYRLVEENTKEAKRYLEELKKLNSAKAEKFKDYFN